MKHALLVLVAAFVAACASSGGSSPSIVPSPEPSGAPLSEPQLKVALLDRFGELWFCDPDEFPVARGDEAELALARFPEIEADPRVLQTIVDWIEFERVGTFTPKQKLEIYRAWKWLNAIVLTDVGNGRYRFDILTRSAQTPQGGIRTAGLIARDGTIEIEAQMPSGEPACPICLGQGTLIATPGGPVPVGALRVGDEVWTLDDAGRRIVARIENTGIAVAPVEHRVVRLVLADGRTVSASPGHPLADGRLLGAIARGDIVDGSRVISAERVPYGGSRTFDLLPGGPTGVYWADQVLLGSTLGA